VEYSGGDGAGVLFGIAFAALVNLYD